MYAVTIITSFSAYSIMSIARIASNRNAYSEHAVHCRFAASLPNGIITIYFLFGELKRWFITWVCSTNDRGFTLIVDLLKNELRSTIPSRTNLYVVSARSYTRIQINKNQFG